MTNNELIDMLSKHPLDAEVLIYSAETNKLAPITGCIVGFNPRQDGNYTIELCSDDMQG